jgi:16S rRNA (adenine1518-N6/adenine1519-N6)-dimethyltransferase
LPYFHLLESGDFKNYTHSILSEYAVGPKRKYGQNFVIKKNLIDKIISVAQISSNDIVIEVGGGIGTLTYFLLKNARSVYSYEIDPLLASILKKEFYAFKDQLEIISGDFLSEEVNFHHKLVSNLPYVISSPFIWKISNMTNPPEMVVITVQKEFANHLCADPSSSNYSRLSVYSSYFFKFERIEDFKPHYFLPKPRVTSSLVQGTRVDPPSVVKEKQFFPFLTALFCRKHKKARNNLLFYQKRIPRPQRKQFRTELDSIKDSSEQPINLNPTQIISLYSNFNHMISEKFDNIDIYGMNG